MSDFLEKIIWNNTYQEWIIALAITIGLTIAFLIFQKIILNKLKKLAGKTKNEIDDIIIDIITQIKPPLYFFIALYIGIQTLNLPDLAVKIISVIVIVWIIVIATKAAQILISRIFEKKVDEDDARGSKSAFSAIKIIIKIVIWSLGLLLLLSNLGIDITSLIAGLGIGGIAVALALQNILSDLFSSFAIHFDRPFIVGDFIIVGDKMGTVEKIGIKTTRLQALQGEEIIISNKELTTAKIQNFKKMKKRRIVFTIGCTYETPSEKLKSIPHMIETAFSNIENVTLDRAHFKEFADSALVFEIAYYVEVPDYNEYMAAQQEINLKIRYAFEKENIEMAYPTQTIHLKKE